MNCSTESSGFSLRLEESKDVADSDGTFHVSHQSSGWLVDERDFHLCNTSSGSYKQRALRGTNGSLLTSFAENRLDAGVCDFRTIHIFAGA